MPVSQNNIDEAKPEIVSSKDKEIIALQKQRDKVLFDLYADHYRLYQFKRESTIADLYKLCEYLIQSCFLGNAAAKSESKNASGSYLSYEFLKTLEKEFSLRLEELNQDSSKYTAAQNSLFILNYTKKYNQVYSCYADRYTEIYLALINLKNSADTLDEKLQSFAKAYVLGYPNNLTDDNIKSSTWNILIKEVLGEDLLFEVITSSHSKLLFGSVYPFRILSKQHFIQEITPILEDSPELIANAAEYYENLTTTTIKRLNTKKQTDGKYHISLTSEQFNDASTLYFINADNEEIGRIEILDQEIYFRGFGEWLNITIHEPLDYTSCIVENEKGNITLNAEFQQTQVLYFTGKVKQLILNSSIYSHSEVKFDIKGTLQVPKNMNIKTQAAINIRSSSLILEGNVLSDEYVQIHTTGSFSVSALASCHGTTGVNITAQNANQVTGKITSDKSIALSLTQSANIGGTACIEGKDNVAIKAKSCMVSRKSSIQTQGHLYFEINDVLIIEDKTQLNAKTIFIKAKTFKDYSPNIYADKIIIHHSENAEIYPSGALNSTELLQFRGNSVWNGGKLQFGKALDAKLNKVFVHGVANLNLSALAEAAKNSSISGENLHIVAGVVFGALGSCYVRSKTIIAIAELGSDFTTSKYSRKSRLLSFECNIDLPNMAVIYKDLSDLCASVQKGQYESALKSIFSLEAVTNTITVTRWIVRMLCPGVGKVTDTVWSVLILITSLPALFKQCVVLYEKSLKGEKVEYYDLYHLIAIAGGVSIQAFNLEGQIANGIVEGISADFSISNLTKDIPALTLNLASQFFQSSTDEAFIGVSSGLTSNASIMRRNLMSYEMWCTEIGFNISHSFYNATQQHQNTIAADLSNIGHDLTRSGNVLTKNDVVTVDNLNESSHIVARSVVWSTDNTNEYAEVYAQTIQGNARHHFSHNGNLSATQSVQLIADNLETRVESKTTAENIGLFGTEIKNRGTSNAKTFTMIGSNTAESTNTSAINAERVYEDSKKTLQNGTINVIPSTELSIEMKADAPPANADKSKNETPAIDPHVIINGQDSATLGADCHIDGANATVLISGKTVTDHGVLNVNHAILSGTNVNLENDAYITTKKCIINVENEAKLAGRAVITHKDAKHDENKNSDKNKTETDSKEEPTVDPGLLVQAKTITVDQTSQIAAVDATTAFIADNMTDNGSNLSHTLIVETKQHYDMTSTAVHTAVNTSYTAHTASFKGIVNSQSTNLNVETGLDIDKLLTHSNEYANFHAGNDLQINTQDAYTVNKNLNLDINLGIICKSFNANNKSINDDQNLSIKTTGGDISFKNSNIRSAKTLYLDSARDFDNDHSNVWTNILSVNVQNNITNRVGLLSANTYLQLIAEKSSIFNLGETQNRAGVPTYIPSIIRGGTGVGFDGLGSYIKAGNKVCNWASVIDSASSLYVQAKGGIENRAVTLSYHLPNHSVKSAGGISRALDQAIASKIHPALAPTVVSQTIAGQITSNGKTTLVTDDDILNEQSRIVGIETCLHASRGNIKNIAGLVQGIHYLEVVAGKNIENTCKVFDVHGQYDTLKKYEIGQFIGGTGEGYNGVGLLVQADGLIDNDASEFSSIGSNILNGKSGISSTARYNYYTSYYKHKKTWYGKSTTTIDRTYQIQDALIYSANGSNTLISENGAINACSTDFISAHDTIFSAKGKVNLSGYVLNNYEYKDKSSLWNLVDQKTKQIDDVALPTIIANPGNTTIVSLDDVNMTNASVSTLGKLTIHAKDILISAPTLNHVLTSESRGFNFSYPAAHMTNASPLYNDYQALKHSQNGIEWVANTWNAGFDGVNALNNVISGLRNGSVLQSIFPASYLTGVEIGYSHNKSVAKYQTVAPNAISCGSLDLNAGNAITFANGIPVSVAGDANINARIFSQTGAALNSSVSSSAQSVSVGLSLASDPNFGVSASGSVARSTNYANQLFQVGGKATIHANEWSIHNGNLIANQVDARVGLLSVITDANTSTSSSWSASVNTNGSAAFQKSTNTSALVGTASGIYAANGIHLNADKMSLVGGVISSPAESQIYAKVIESRSVEQYNRGSSSGLPH